ncbi:hypothetical protein [Paractinoplanes globisporus]|uniref:Uncharacterized protein n=1 Tax=Paractinoplanes globisporus TaxID=113565 RepID=A0ABW6WXB9_9ACTN|nr:hypothetical protein [Actinoplanes globisporus]
MFGILAGMISCVDAVPYIRGILRGSTRPHRGTWCIWSILGVTAFASQAADGGGWSLLMLGIQAVSITVILVLSTTRGVGGLDLGNFALLVVAALGLAGWLALSTPVLATVCVVVADLAGALLMLPKMWRDPDSETASSFLLAGIAGGLGAASVGSLQPELLLYPVYFGVVNGAIAAIVVLRRKRADRQRPGRHGAERYEGVDACSGHVYRGLAQLPGR